MKNFREYFRECFEAEKPKFIRVIKAVPADHAAYRPHPRSTSAGDLVWLLASELRDACELIERGEVSYVPRPAPSVAESVAAYERNAEDLQKRLATVDDSKWDRKARLLGGRKRGMGNLAGGHALRVSLRRDSPPRTAFELSASDGREGSGDLWSIGGRSGDVGRIPG